MSRIIELKWNCGECSTRGILGRHKRCPSCGSPREKGEMKMDGLNTDRDGDGYNDAASVTDPELLRLATAGADWFCTHCGSGNIGNGDRCGSCAAPRYGDVDEDHPDFAGDHKKVDTTDDPWEDDYDPTTWTPGESERVVVESTPHKGNQPFYDAYKRGQESDPVEDYKEQRRKAAERQKMYAIGGGVLLLTLLLGFIIWAFQTHEVEGTVSKMTWTQTTIVQTWTPVDTRLWRHETSERSEIQPVNGSGERAGIELLGGCRQEHHHYEQYQCGTRQESYDCSYTESYQDTCTRSESYACGETCRDNGNGFATCTTKYCSRQVSYSCTKTRRVPKTCERTVPKYCDRSIKKTRCDYRTQEWKTTRTLPASGRGYETQWPEVDPRPLDRLRYTADYTILIAYTDRGEDHIYEHKPVDTSRLLGGRKLMLRRQAREAENQYHNWEPGEEVTVVVNNLGGIHEVRHGTETIQAEAQP